MHTVEEHIAKDKAILDDPTINPAARRHYKEELHSIQVKKKINKLNLQ